MLLPDIGRPLSRGVVLLALFRWQFWPVSIVPVLIGYTLGPDAVDLFKLIALALVFGPCLEGAAEAINDYFDAENDRVETVQAVGGVQLSGGTGLIQRGMVSKSEVLYLALVADAIGLLLALAFFPPPFILTAICGVVLGLAYSAPPIRLKERGILGPLAIGISFGCVTVIGGYTAGGGVLNAPMVIAMLPLIVLVSGLFLTHQIVDYEADLAAASQTFCVRHGIVKTRIASAVLIVAGATTALSIQRHMLPVGLVIVCGLVWVLVALGRGKITPPIRVAAVALQATASMLLLQ